MIKKEFLIFLVVGVSTVLVDFLAYKALLSLTPLSVDLCKMVSFLTGTVFAYFANRKWTFGHTVHSQGSVYRFAILYAVTLCLNVSINTLFLKMLEGVSKALSIAFIIATGVSAMTNFIGMKFFVFNSKISTRENL
jgi:putative flippase GtrA